jgi:hypothetical protein
MCYNILTAVIKGWTATNKDNPPELSVASVNQPVVADRGPCRDLPRKLPRDKTFMFNEKKREATHLPTQGEEDSSTEVGKVLCRITNDVGRSCVELHNMYVDRLQNYRGCK